MSPQPKFTMTELEQLVNPDAPGFILRALSHWGSVIAQCAVGAAPGFDPVQVREEFSRNFYIYYLGQAGHA